MKITTFNPQIVTKDPAPILELFEELGFEKRHQKEGVGSQGVTEIRMKDANGFYLDVAVTEHIPGPDIPTMRMNVDDFEEAYALLTEHGFTNFYADQAIHTPSSMSALMVSPHGFAINLVKHFRKPEKLGGQTEQ